MLGLRRDALEYLVIGLSSTRIAYSLWSVAGTGWELIGLVCVTVAGVAHEVLSTQHRSVHGYDTKVADSEGLALGTVALPWTLTALMITDLQKKASSGYSLLACRSSLASSALALLWLSSRAYYTSTNKRASSASPPSSHRPSQHPMTSPVPPTQLMTKASPATAANDLPQTPTDVESGVNTSRLNRRLPHHQSRNAARFHLMQNARQAIPDLKFRESKSEGAVIGTLAALVFLLLCIPLLPGGVDAGVRGSLGQFSSSAGMVMNAAVATAALHLVLTQFPRCFTIGEAMVVSQSLGLLITDSISFLTALSASQLHSSPTMFNPPSTPQRTPHPLLKAELDMNMSSLAQKVVGSVNVSRSIRNMILDSIYESENFGKGWLGYNIMPRAPTAVFVELLICASLLVAVVMTPLTRKLVQKLWQQRQITGHVPMFVGLVFLIAAAAIDPAVWAVSFALATSWRQLLLAYWLLLLATALPLIHWVAAANAMPTILIRKGYHLLALGLFLPALLWEPQLLSISLAIAFALLVVLEVVRLGGVPYIGERIHAFMMSFTDGRDAGLLLVSHFSLLTGMAAPIWLSSVTTISTSSRHEASDLSHLYLQTFGRSTVANPRTEAGTPLPLTAFAGIMILGIADSAASAIGKKYGRHRICIGTKKTVEGTLGAALLTLLGWALVAMVFQSHLSNSASATWDGMAGAKLLTSTLLSCLLEASTTQLDNIFMPLHYFAMLSL